MIDMTKKIVQVSAKESQKHHVELIETSKEIDELKKKKILSMSKSIKSKQK